MSSNIDYDEDAPPDLIDVSAMPADQTTSIEEEVTARVPITLVTGMYMNCSKHGIVLNAKYDTLKDIWVRVKPPS